jgi:hypothetical protein
MHPLWRYEGGSQLSHISQPVSTSNSRRDYIDEVRTGEERNPNHSSGTPIMRAGRNSELTAPDRTAEAQTKQEATSNSRVAFVYVVSTGCAMVGDVWVGLDHDSSMPVLSSAAHVTTRASVYAPLYC